MITRLAIALGLVGCPAPGTYYAGAPTTTQPVTTQPAPPDNRVSGQVFIDNIVSFGYQCKNWYCWSPTPSNDKFALANWQVIVAYDSTSTGPVWPVYLKSAAPRAFGTACPKFEHYLNDLVDAPNKFQVTCDDSSQTFIMITTVDLEAGMAGDLSRQWLEQHVANRANAWKLLNSVGAIRSGV